MRSLPASLTMILTVAIAVLFLTPAQSVSPRIVPATAPFHPEPATRLGAQSPPNGSRAFADSARDTAASRNDGQPGSPHYGVPQNAEWTNLSSTLGVAPAPTLYQAMAFDPADNYTVLFGGLSVTPVTHAINTTWAFANGSWKQLQPAVSPSARRGAAPPP